MPTDDQGDPEAIYCRWCDTGKVRLRGHAFCAKCDAGDNHGLIVAPTWMGLKP